jgi:hypothetical protein
MSNFASLTTIAAIVLLVAAPLSAQDAGQPLAPKHTSPVTKPAKQRAIERNRSVFAHVPQPSTAKNKKHRLILQVNTNDPATMNLALNNAMNVTRHYRNLDENVEIEVVAFGPGLHMLRDDTSPVKARIETMALSTPEVSFKACGITQENMHKAESKDIRIIPQAQVVESGVVRVMELEEQGWTYVKP